MPADRSIVVYFEACRAHSHPIASRANLNHTTVRAQADAYSYGTVSFFGGILFYKGIDILVHMLDGSAGDHGVDVDLYDLDMMSERPPDPEQSQSAAQVGAAGGGAETNADKTRPGAHPHGHHVVVELESGNSTVRPTPDLQHLNLRMAGKVQQPKSSPAAPNTPPGPKVETGLGAIAEGATSGQDGADAEGQVGDPTNDTKLVRMGVMTAVAIGIHNFPEGLATFVSTLSDPSVGAALAIAIAIHNIPEGLCVAIPVYYATGNRWKAFGWALLSGISEPIGAGIGWIVLKDHMSETVYGILFGVVAGMMVTITIHELIPTAIRYDPADKVTTNSIVVGMAIMALSLLLFKY